MRAAGVRWLRAGLCFGLAACGGTEWERGPDPDAGRSDAGERDAGMECDEWPVAAGGETVVEGLGGPLAIAVDDEFVYWTQGQAAARGGSAIGRARKSGGPAELLAEGLDHPVALAVTPRELIWSEVGVESEFSGRVVARDKDDGAIRVLAGGLRFPWGLAADERAVFWTSENRTTGELELWTLEAAAGEPRRVLSVADAVEPSVPNSTLYLSEQAVIWAIGTASGVSRSAAAPGVLTISRDASETAIAVVTGRSVDFAVASSDTVYFVQRREGVFRVAIGSDDEPSLIAPTTPGTWLQDLVRDERNVYWLESGRMQSIPLASEAKPSPLTDIAPNPMALATDGEFVYAAVFGMSGGFEWGGYPCGMVQRFRAP